MKNINPVFALARADEKTLNIYLYDEIESDSYDWWTGELIESNTSANAIAKALDGADGVEQINVYINSYGGEVKEGLGIYSQLQRVSANVTAFIDGFACSIASVIAMAANKVVMNPASLMMIHRAWTVAAGNAEELRKAADDLEVIDSSIRSAYLNKVGEKMDEKKLTSLLNSETWLTAQQCLDYGLCDEIALPVETDTQKELNSAIDNTKQAAIENALRNKLEKMFAAKKS